MSLIETKEQFLAFKGEVAKQIDRIRAHKRKEEYNGK